MEEAYDNILYDMNLSNHGAHDLHHEGITVLIQ